MARQLGLNTKMFGGLLPAEDKKRKEEKKKGTALEDNPPGDEVSEDPF